MTRGRCSAGSALTASTTDRVTATRDRLISALCAAVHLVAIGSPATRAYMLLQLTRLQLASSKSTRFWHVPNRDRSGLLQLLVPCHAARIS